MRAMSTAEELAAELERAYQEFADYVAGLSPQAWRATAVNSPDVVRGADESRPVGVVAHHVGDTLPMVIERARQLAADGEVERLTPADIEGINAMHAAANASPAQAETVALIRDNGSRAAALLRELSDEALARQGVTGAGPTTPERMIRMIAIGHVRWHLGSIRATVEEQARRSGGARR
jgi:hypothetical protein